MAGLIIFYLTILAIGLSLFHSYRIVQRGAEPAATVNAMQSGRREKRLLLWALGLGALYAIAVFALALLREGMAVYVVLTPFIYLLAWSLPRLFLNRLD